MHEYMLVIRCYGITHQVQWLWIYSRDHVCSCSINFRAVKCNVIMVMYVLLCTSCQAAQNGELSTKLLQAATTDPGKKYGTRFDMRGIALPWVVGDTPDQANIGRSIAACCDGPFKAKLARVNSLLKLQDPAAQVQVCYMAI
jgi:hypothetical protein